jgi:hypothetical protein
LEDSSYDSPGPDHLADAPAALCGEIADLNASSRKDRHGSLIGDVVWLWDEGYGLARLA